MKESIAILFCGLFSFIDGRIPTELNLKTINVTQSIILNKEWNCSLSPDLLEQNITEDSHLYKNTTLFFVRRSAAKYYLNLPQWSSIVATAWKEIATASEGEITKEIRKNGLYDPLLDFVEHINYFETVRGIMHQRGEKFCISGKQHSTIHDVDKLHPIMLASYAEKFQDGKDTSLWNVCVDNHIAINPHHQGNFLWQNGHCSNHNFSGKNCYHYENICYNALLEMICDKVSRKVQKELNGKISEDMWNVDRKFFLGLPELWLNEAYKILDNLKQS